MTILSQLFKKQGDFFDVPTSNLTPVQIRENLAKIAAEVIPSHAVEEFRELLKLKGSPNGGVAVTDDLKYNSACGLFRLFYDYPDWSQSNSRGKTAFTCRQLSCGMG